MIIVQRACCAILPPSHPTLPAPAKAAMTRDRFNASPLSVLTALMRRSTARFMACQSGVAALEFALIAPMLILGLISVADIGMATNERMVIGQTLRTAAQTALLDQGPDALYAALRSASTANFSAVLRGAVGTTSTLALDASRFCACPQNTALTVLCAITCASNRPTQVYYLLTASKLHKSMLLPNTTITARLLVQSR